MAASPVEARNNRPEVVVRARMRAAAATATATPGKKTRRTGVLSRISSFSSQTKLHSISSTSGFAVLLTTGTEHASSDRSVPRPWQSAWQSTRHH
jgi:hypothetical protein